MKSFARRRQRLVQKLKNEQLDALLIANPVNVTYLTGFSGESSMLILTRQTSILVSDARFAEQIAEECPGLEAVIRSHSQPLLPAVVAELGKLGARAVGFESGYVSVAARETLGELAPRLAWKGRPDWVEPLRAIKDAAEVAQIREAIVIAERAYSMLRAMLRPEDTERESCDNLEIYIRRAGGWSSSFPSIVAGSTRSALAHAPPTDQCVGDTGLVLVDWGASGRFYKSDLTRVFATRRISPKLERIYAVVREAQAKAIAKIRPGVAARDVDAEARSVVDAAGFGPFFSHGLGHGIGLEVHEAPAIRTESKDVLQVGMVFTIEPGIYLPGWGGVRLEDDVLVTAAGAEVLTQASRELTALFGG